MVDHWWGGSGFFDDSLVEVGEGGLGVFDSLEAAVLDLDGGSLVEVGVEAGEFFDDSLVKGAVKETSFWDLDGDGSLVEVGSGRKLVEGGGFFMIPWWRQARVVWECLIHWRHPFWI